MKKTTIIILIGLLIIGVAIPFTYILFEDMRPAIGDFFGGLRQSATVLFWGFSDQFMQLPYWEAIAIFLGFIGGIVLDRWAWGIMLGIRKKLVSTAINDTGLRQEAPYQGAPGYEQSQSAPPKQTDVKELEAK